MKLTTRPTPQEVVKGVEAAEPPYDNPESSDKLNTLFVSKGVVTSKVDIDRMAYERGHTIRSYWLHAVTRDA